MKTQFLQVGWLLMISLLLPFKDEAQILPVPQKIKALGKAYKYPNGQLVNGKIIFFNNTLPWITDGTANGTQLIKDIDPNTTSTPTPYSYPLGVFKNLVFFYYAANNAQAGIYRTDGTADGTYRISQLSTYNLAILDDKVLFFNITSDSDPKKGLYSTDGTVSGTKLITGKVSSVSSIDSKFYKIGNIYYFFSSNAISATQGLWKTDGTEAGTTLIKDVTQGQSVGTAFSDGTRLFFTVPTGAGSVGWRSDGTATGTILLPNITLASTYLFGSVNGGHLLYSPDAYGRTLLTTSTDQTSSTTLTTEHNYSPSIGITPTTYYYTNGINSPYTYMQTDGTIPGTKVMGIPKTSSNPGIITKQGITYFFTDGLYTNIVWRIDEQGQLRQLNKDENGGAKLPSFASLDFNDKPLSILGESNGKLLFIGSDPETSGVDFGYALSSIELTPSCSIKASIAGNSNLPCTANAVVLLTATATDGTAPFSYQWKRNSTLISGATSVTYAAGSAGDYTVLITDSKSCSTVAATKTVATKPVSVSLNGPDKVCASYLSSTQFGGYLRAGITDGTSPFTYRWAVDNKPLATTSTDVLISQFGVYSLTVTDACSSSVISKTVTAAGTLDVTVLGSSAGCTGQPTALTAVASGGQELYTYEWALNGTTTVVSRTAILPVTAANGIYNLSVSSGYVCPVFKSVQKGSSLPVTATITGSTTLCSGQPGTLNANLANGSGPFIYVWKQNGVVVGTNAALLSITGGGAYSLSVTDACSSTTASFSVAESPSPVVSISGTLTVCSGQATTLTASATGGTGAYAFQWRQSGANVGTTTSITAASGNTYTVSLTDAKGCAAMANATISVGVCAGATVMLPASGTTATLPITLTASTGLTGGIDVGATYQWLLNGNAISGATTPTYTASSSGSYAVAITLNGRTVTSAAVVLTINLPLAIEPLSDSQVTVYPNPSSGECWVKLEVMHLQTVGLRLCDALGRSLRHWSVDVTPKQPPLRISLPEAGGLYLLRVETETGVVVKKLERIR